MLQAAANGVSGTLYRVGPCAIPRGGVKPAHLFDGDGRVDKIVLVNNKVVDVRSRTIETPQFLKEQAANQFLYRGAFGTAAHRGLHTLKNPLNTAVTKFKNNLYVMWDGGKSGVLDEETLEFKRFETFDGDTRQLFPFTLKNAFLDQLFRLGGEAWSAHPVHDKRRNVFVCMSAAYTHNTTTITFREMNLDDGFLEAKHVVRLAGFVHVHSFALDDNEIVFFAPSTKLHFGQWNGGRSLLDSVEQHTGPTRVIRVDRNLSFHYIYASSFDVMATHVVAFKNNTVYFTGANTLSSKSTFNLFRGKFSENTQTFEFQILDTNCEFPQLSPCGRFIAYAGSSSGKLGLMNTWKIYDMLTGACRSCKFASNYIFSEPLWALNSHTIMGICIDDNDETNLAIATSDGRNSMQKVAGLNKFGLHGFFVPIEE
jgi:carotenoid cleavage dioxygenase-like enzyme